MRVVRVSIMTVVNISKNNDLQRNSGWDLRTERCGEWGLRRSLVWEVTVVHWSGHTRIWRSLDGDGCCLGRTWSRFIEAVKHRCWVILVYPTHQGGGLSCAGRTETTDCVVRMGMQRALSAFFKKKEEDKEKKRDPPSAGSLPKWQQQLGLGWARLEPGAQPRCPTWVARAQVLDLLHLLLPDALTGSWIQSRGGWDLNLSVLGCGMWVFQAAA